MRKVFFYLIASLSLFSCSGNKETKNNKETPQHTDTLSVSRHEDSEEDKKDFSARFAAMINTFGSQDMEELNKYISPEFGLLLIESESGAMPHFHIQKADDESYRHCVENICNNISFDRNLREESLPKIDCDSKDLYTKTGSFVQDTNNLLGSEIWKYGNLAPEDQKFAERVINSITKTVITTYGYTYYFTYYKDNWYLTVIDTRRPCEA